MTPPTYDVIVAGLGAMGSATLWQLARRGQKVLGVDKFAPPHSLGSSHGKSRIIREAYFEDPLYVPFVQRAYGLWAELEAASGTTIFTQTGGLMLGPPTGELVTGAQLSATMHALPHELLSASQVAERFPAFRPDPGMVGVWEPRAGFLNPEAGIGAALQVAQQQGADVRLNEALASWRPTATGVEVTTTRGTYHARRLVLSVGAWAGKVLGDLRLPLVVQRNVLYWFSPTAPSDHFGVARFPIFLCEFKPGKSLYGFPDVGDGIKLALHHHGPASDPDTINRTVGPEEVEELRGIIARYVPEANGALRDTAVCMYTNTPDEHFIIDRHPADDRVIVASPCSGHGFKFAPVIGETLADLAMDRAPRFDLSTFALARFTPA
jgi:sarcosine oxidase